MNQIDNLIQEILMLEGFLCGKNLIPTAKFFESQRLILESAATLAEKKEALNLLAGAIKISQFTDVYEEGERRIKCVANLSIHLMRE